MDYNIIIGVACFGAVLQTLPIWDQLLEKLHIDVKPFNCALCMTFLVFIRTIHYYRRSGRYI